MNDRDAEHMAGRADENAVVELDRLLDALASGDNPVPDDRLFSMLAAARRELDAADTASPGAAPDVSAVWDATVTPISEARHRRRRGLGFTGRAAAAGGLSVTGMVIAAGAAAAIAVGGFGVAAYHGVIPGIPAHNSVSGDDGAEVVAPSSESSSAVSSTTRPEESPKETDEGTGGAEEIPTTGATSVEPSEPTEPGTETSEPSGTTEPTETTEPGDPTEQPDPTEPDHTGPAEPTETTSPTTDKVGNPTGESTTAGLPAAAVFIGSAAPGASAV